MEMLLDTASWVLLVVGGFFVFAGGLGALRMPDFYTRMHAASLTDTLGTILVLTGLMLQAGISLAAVKLLAIMGLLLRADGSLCAGECCAPLRTEALSPRRKSGAVIR